MTLVMQSRELKLQRKELALQRDELNLTRKELAQSATAQTYLASVQAHQAVVAGAVALLKFYGDAYRVPSASSLTNLGPAQLKSHVETMERMIQDALGEIVREIGKNVDQDT